MRPTTRRFRKVLGTALGAALLAGAVLPAFAALGGDAASVDADVAKMKGQARATAVARLHGERDHSALGHGGARIHLTWRERSSPSPGTA